MAKAPSQQPVTGRARPFVLGADLRCLPSDGSPGAGVAHAARALWREFCVQAPAFDIRLIGFATGDAALGNLPFDRKVRTEVVRLCDVRGSSLRRAVQEYPVDALFVPSGAVPFGLAVPAYPWVHDLAIFDHPEWFPQSWWRRQRTTRLFLRGLRRAPAVFAVSRDTKQSIERIARVAAANIFVTGEGVRSPAAKDEPDLTAREPYALILGTVEPRKNIPFITELWSEVCQKVGRTVELVVAGQDGWGDVPLDQTMPELVRLANVGDAEHDRLIREAAVVLVPSLHEGFGRTALEAMAAGTPVIASDRGALPEVVDDAGIVLPLERETWIKAIHELLTDPDKRKILGQKGMKRAAGFTWTSVAQTILAKLVEN